MSAATIAAEQKKSLSTKMPGGQPLQTDTEIPKQKYGMNEYAVF
jgi:hypothetical protein